MGNAAPELYKTIIDVSFGMGSTIISDALVSGFFENNQPTESEIAEPSYINNGPSLPSDNSGGGSGSSGSSGGGGGGSSRPALDMIWSFRGERYAQ